MIDDKDFAVLCFNVLMANDKGYITKHPTYTREKLWLLDAGVDAFGALDIHNQRKVLDYLKEWKLEAPEKITKYIKEAADMGVFI